jgi:hypothetical protein
MAAAAAAVKPHFPRQLRNNIILHLEIVAAAAAGRRCDVSSRRRYGAGVEKGAAARHAESLARHEHGGILIEGEGRGLEEGVSNRGVGVDRGR